jgi:hypothetical protein
MQYRVTITIAKYDIIELNSSLYVSGFDRLGWGFNRWFLAENSKDTLSA